MSYLEEEKVVAENQHDQLALNDMENKDSVLLYINNFADKVSPQYGDFVSVQGLKLDLAATDEASLLSSAHPASFIPNTMLKNKIEQNSLVKGEVYRLEKAWTLGEKFSDGKIAKGHGFNLYKIKLGEGTLSELESIYKSKLSGAVNTAGTPAEAPSKKSVKI